MELEFLLYRWNFFAAGTLSIFTLGIQRFLRLVTVPPFLPTGSRTSRQFHSGRIEISGRCAGWSALDGSFGPRSRRIGFCRQNWGIKLADETCVVETFW